MEEANTKVEEISAKVGEVREELNNSREKVEKITGAFDIDNNGKVSLKEAKEIIANNKGQWFNVDFWIQLILALLGITVAKKGTKPLIATLHRVGRNALIEKGEPSSSSNKK